MLGLKPAVKSERSLAQQNYPGITQQKRSFINQPNNASFGSLDQKRSSHSVMNLKADQDTRSDISQSLGQKLINSFKYFNN